MHVSSININMHLPHVSKRHVQPKANISSILSKLVSLELYRPMRRRRFLGHAQYPWPRSDGHLDRMLKGSSHLFSQPHINDMTCLEHMSRNETMKASEDG
jgi:hypothetical protein